MACYLVNRSPHASLDGKVVKEVWTCNLIDLSNLRIFGCLTYMHIPSEDRSELDPKSKQCIFIGYNKGVKGYKLQDLVKRKVVVSRDVIFDEQLMLKHSNMTIVPDTGVKSSSHDKIQVDIEEPPMSPRQIVAKQQDEPDSDSSGMQDSGGVPDYTLMRDRELHRITPLVKYEFEDLATYDLLTISRDPSTF